MKKLFIVLLLFTACEGHITKMEAFSKLDKEAKTELIEELNKMVHADQYYRKLSSSLDKTSKNYSQKKDSIWNIIDSIDMANTKRLIEVTKKYGFLNVDRLGKNATPL